MTDAHLPPFDDPCVQAAYEVLCSDEAPPPEQHWEGYAARRIVARVYAALAEDCAKAVEALRDDHCRSTQDADPDGQCHPDDASCDFVAAWNDAAQAIRAKFKA